MRAAAAPRTKILCHPQEKDWIRALDLAGEKGDSGGIVIKSLSFLE
jgi:hypothetical protein